jgi:hypothetical protein
VAGYRKEKRYGVLVLIASEEAIALLAVVPAILIGQIATDHVGSETPRRSRPI